MARAMLCDRDFSRIIVSSTTFTDTEQRFVYGRTNDRDLPICVSREHLSIQRPSLVSPDFHCKVVGINGVSVVLGGQPDRVVYKQNESFVLNQHETVISITKDQSVELIYLKTQKRPRDESAQDSAVSAKRLKLECELMELDDDDDRKNANAVILYFGPTRAYMTKAEFQETRMEKLRSLQKSRLGRWLAHKNDGTNVIVDDSLFEVEMGLESILEEAPLHIHFDKDKTSLGLSLVLSGSVAFDDQAPPYGYLRARRNDGRLMQTSVGNILHKAQISLEEIAEEDIQVAYHLLSKCSLLREKTTEKGWMAMIPKGQGEVDWLQQLGIDEPSDEEDPDDDDDLTEGEEEDELEALERTNEDAVQTQVPVQALEALDEKDPDSNHTEDAPRTSKIGWVRHRNALREKGADKAADIDWSGFWERKRKRLHDTRYKYVHSCFSKPDFTITDLDNEILIHIEVCGKNGRVADHEARALGYAKHLFSRQQGHRRHAIVVLIDAYSYRLYYAESVGDVGIIVESFRCSCWDLEYPLFKVLLALLGATRKQLGLYPKNLGSHQLVGCIGYGAEFTAFRCQNQMIAKICVNGEAFQKRKENYQKLRELNENLRFMIIPEVSDYVENVGFIVPNLSDSTRLKELPEKSWLEFGTNLNALHDAQWAHMDVFESNLFVKNEVILLNDFGSLQKISPTFSRHTIHTHKQIFPADAWFEQGCVVSAMYDQEMTLRTIRLVHLDEASRRQALRARDDEMFRDGDVTLRTPEDFLQAIRNTFRTSVPDV